MKDKSGAINDEYKKLSAEGFRVLGVAYKKGSNDKNFTKADEDKMIFLGFITLFDPPKKGSIYLPYDEENIVEYIDRNCSLHPEKFISEVAYEFFAR